jgi:hypothetical protein
LPYHLSYCIRTYKDGEYPGLKWAWELLGAFGTATYLLGTLLNWWSAVALLAGAAAVLLVAGTISATSHILGTNGVSVTNGH